MITHDDLVALIHMGLASETDPEQDAEFLLEALEGWLQGRMTKTAHALQAAAMLREGVRRRYGIEAAELLFRMMVSLRTDVAGLVELAVMLAAGGGAR